MAQIEKLFPFILKWEGGFVHDPADAGGATNMGVTFATFQAYCRIKGYPHPTIERLKNISLAQVQDIMKTMYWDKWKADEIQSQKVANILADWYWCSGKWGIVIPQRVLKIADDGIVGPITIAAVNSREPHGFFNDVYNARAKYLHDITSNSIASYEHRIGRKATEKELLQHTNKRFLKGWMNRLESIKTF